MSPPGNDGGGSVAGTATTTATVAGVESSALTALAVPQLAPDAGGMETALAFAKAGWFVGPAEASETVLGALRNSWAPFQCSRENADTRGHHIFRQRPGRCIGNSA